MDPFALKDRFSISTPTSSFSPIFPWCWCYSLYSCSQTRPPLGADKVRGTLSRSVFGWERRAAEVARGARDSLVCSFLKPWSQDRGGGLCSRIALSGAPGSQRCGGFERVTLAYNSCCIKMLNTRVMCSLLTPGRAAQASPFEAGFGFWKLDKFLSLLNTWHSNTLLACTWLVQTLQFPVWPLFAPLSVSQRTNQSEALLNSLPLMRWSVSESEILST